MNEHVTLNSRAVFGTPTINAAVKHFPDLDWDGWVQKFNDQNQVKRGCNKMENIGTLHQCFVDIIEHAMGTEFTAMLSEKLGIPNLLPDPTLRGGGLHLLPVGGKLAMHVDFNRYGELYRRANVLVYLNKGFTEADGGYLELWTGEKVLPNVPNMVAFTTTDTSWHGNPAEAKKVRASMAFYYYTKERPEWYKEQHSTLWK